ncbi:5' nucleotidase, NT5C type [Pseudactinotalea terrae]|uniref:5' nucleotidase, NT5C type n=1 Tax=Pseudactinotalea terrae TaxID=1743262 RepID=UPI0012E0FE85|nr:hypothetical protein [Pseudactinotalea terrae]
MPVLVLDLDNTTFDYNAALAGHVLRTERRVVPAQVPHYSFANSGWFADTDHFLRTHREAVRAGLFAHMAPYPDAIETLHGLREAGWYIKVATHRLIGGIDEHLVRASTLAGLDRVGMPYDEVHFVADKHTVPGDIWADDKPRVLTDLDALGLPRLAYRHAYNAHVPGPGVGSWRELGRYLRTFALEVSAAPA